MPNDLINTDPLVANSFFLEIDGQVVTSLSSVSGLDIELEMTEFKQVGKDGKMQMVKVLGNQTKAPDLTLVRMATTEFQNDPMWKWFNAVREGGMDHKKRDGGRKNGSIVMYDTANTEVARFNFFNGWPTKIATDQLSADSNDVVKETITIVCERLERKK